MIRSVDFPTDPRWIKNPTNSPLATPGARQAAAAQTRLTIATIALILTEYFKKPGLHFVDGTGFTRPNLWTVRLTRISTGTVDPITGGASMKSIQDAVARWCDVANERDPVWQWIEPIGQEKRGWVSGSDGSKRAWTGVRIEIDDLATGEPRTIVLETIAGFVLRAKADLKAREKAKKMRGRAQVYHAAEGQKAASTAARGKAEAAFAKVTGKAPRGDRRVRSIAEQDADTKAAARKAPKLAPAGTEDASPRMLVPCKTHGAERGEWCNGKTVCPERARLAGLVTAAERVVPKAPTNGVRKLAEQVPPDLMAMREQARSVACPVPGCHVKAIGEQVGCQEAPGEPFAYGVHLARARAAGLPPFPCAADLDAGAKPVKAPCGLCEGKWEHEICPRCNGAGGSWAWLPGRGAQVWLVLPWLAKTCGLCEGVTPALRVVKDGEAVGVALCGLCNGTGTRALYTRALDAPTTPPDRLAFAVPSEHQATHGRAVTLHRTTITTRAGRLAWLFTMTKERG